jgi:hypothetical protein
MGPYEHSLPGGSQTVSIKSEGPMAQTFWEEESQ